MTQSFGASLREARERKGISLRQIATATKISVASLESLERNDLSKLPGGIFSRAFVRSYAIEVGLDPDETVHRFLQEFEGEHPGTDADPRDIASNAHQGPSHGGSTARSASAGLTPEFDFESRQRMANVVLKLVAVSVPIAAVLLYFTSRGAAPAGLQEPSGEPERPVAEQSATPVASAPRPAPLGAQTGREDQAGPVQAPQRTSPRAGGEPVTHPLPAASPAGVAEEMTIELVPSGDCWAQLTVDGAVVLSRILKAGERETRAFQDSAVLQVGDAAACSILINGRAARPLGPPKKVREVRITRDNYTTFFP